MTDLENGKLVYTEDGAKAEYLGKVENGHVVNVYGEAYDGYGDRFEEPMGIQIAQRVFLTPPVTIYDDQISAKKAEVKEAEQRLREVEKEMREAQSERLAIFKKLAQLPALRHLEDYIEGRITHVLDCSSGYEIKTFEQAFAEQSSYSRKGQKLLTLYGDAKGDLQWRINQYSDGSGWTTDVVPCRSLEEAEAARRTLIAGLLQPAMTDYLGGRKYNIGVMVAAANKFGVPVTEEQRAAYVDAERERLSRELADVERTANTAALRVADTKAKLEAIEATP